MILGAFSAGSVPPATGVEDEAIPLRLVPERVTVDLVLIDVIVTDRRGEPMTGLDVSNFELRIDNHPSEISTFESYCAEPEGTNRSSSSSSGAPLPATSPARHIVLFFDVNQLGEKGRDRSIEASVEYVRERMRPRDRVMIIAMKSHPRLITDFTDDKPLLESHLLRMRKDPELLDRHYLEEQLNLTDLANRECTIPGECPGRRGVAVAYAEEEMLRTKRSLDALRNLMPALGALKGRKTLVHFSESMRDEPGIQYLLLADSTPQTEGIDIKLAITSLQREANAAGVSLYMVWAAGLGEKGSIGMADASRTLRGSDVGRMESALLGSEDAALALGATLALETGGAATARTNDLGLAFEAVERDLSCYYVLGYTNQGPGDGARHMIKVRMDEKRSRVRHRPYYEDWPESVRRDRRFESALSMPDYFDDFPVTAEAYALAPSRRDIPLLLKIEFPLDAVTAVRQPDGTSYGEVEVRTRVWTDGRETCEFHRRIPITLESDEETGSRKVIYEAGCELAAGDHELTVAVLDSGTWEAGATGRTLPIVERTEGIMGDVVLWTPSGDDLLFAEDAASVGIHAGGSQQGFVPRAERRFARDEPGLLYAVICPPQKGGNRDLPAIGIRRKLFSGDTEVARFGDLRLDELRVEEGAGEKPSGACSGLFAPIPAGLLGAGYYTYEVELVGIGEAPVKRRSGVAISGNEELPGS